MYAVFPVTVSVASHLAVSVSPSSPTICSGGSITLSASGATTYVWSPSTGLNTTSGTSVIASPTDTITYTVIGSSSGCSADTTIIVNVNAKPIVWIDSIKKATCSLSNGSATAHGGTTYIWSDGQTTSTASGLAPGHYTVTVSNGSMVSGCYSTDTVTIPAIPSVAIHLVHVDSVLCYGKNNGSITVSASGGDGIYFYHWNNPTPPAQQATVTGLPAGTYTVTVEDSQAVKKFFLLLYISQIN